HVVVAVVRLVPATRLRPLASSVRPGYGRRAAGLPSRAEQDGPPRPRAGLPARRAGSGTDRAAARGPWVLGVPLQPGEGQGGTLRHPPGAAQEQSPAVTDAPPKARLAALEATPREVHRHGVRGGGPACVPEGWRAALAPEPAPPHLRHRGAAGGRARGRPGPSPPPPRRPHPRGRPAGLGGGAAGRAAEA